MRIQQALHDRREFLKKTIKNSLRTHADTKAANFRKMRPPRISDYIQRYVAAMHAHQTEPLRACHADPKSSYH